MQLYHSRPKVCPFQSNFNNAGDEIIASIITIQFCHSLPKACSFQFAIFCRQISNTNTKVAVQYQQSPPPRLNGVLQNLHWRFRQKVWEFFCPNFNGRPPTGTTSQSHSLDSEDEDEEENNISQAQDEANPKGRKMLQMRKTMIIFRRSWSVCVFVCLKSWILVCVSYEYMCVIMCFTYMRRYLWNCDLCYTQSLDCSLSWAGRWTSLVLIV